LGLRLPDTIAQHCVDFGFRLHPVFVGAMARERALFRKVIGGDRNHFMAGLSANGCLRRRPGFFRLDPAFVGALMPETKLAAW